MANEGATVGGGLQIERLWSEGQKEDKALAEITPVEDLRARGLPVAVLLLDMAQN